MKQCFHCRKWIKKGKVWIDVNNLLIPEHMDNSNYVFCSIKCIVEFIKQRMKLLVIKDV